jgi:hypothetical protein
MHVAGARTNNSLTITPKIINEIKINKLLEK